MFLDSRVNYNNETEKYIGIYGNDLKYPLNELEIPVFAQAVQTQGFDSAEAAFAASGFTTDPWNVK